MNRGIFNLLNDGYAKAFAIRFLQSPPCGRPERIESCANPL